MIRKGDNNNQSRFPLIGVFYCYMGNIIAPSHFQKQINPVTRTITPDKRLKSPGEHRDLWDEHIAKNYPEITANYDDNHKSLPRGRVGIYDNPGRLRFLITLDRCIQNKEAEIINLYNLNEYDTDFSYGTLNYICRDCLKMLQGKGEVCHDG